MNVRPAERGFTLVEMLVALMIFAVLAAAGVGLLRSSVDTQQAVGKALADLGEASRLRLLLAGDVAQAVARPVADAPQGFAGDGASMVLVRTFDPAERREGESGLQALRWSLDGDRLVRTALAADGRPASPATTLASDVTSLAFRYRAESGEWRSGWAASASEAALPLAVELQLSRGGQAPVSLVVSLPQGRSPELPQLPATPS